MNRPSRRAFTAAATATLLAGCAAHPRAGSAAPAAETGSPEATPAPGPASVRPLARSVPVRLRIPAIGVDTPLIRLGLAPDGTVEVPPVTAHDRAGWYEHSPTPGRTGPSVVLGHVTVGAYGDGVFRDLARLRRGDRVAARLADGVEAEFTVTDRRTVAKAHFPSAAVYGDVDRPELRLITCGGPRTGDGYADNVIVFAALTSSKRP
ncbi:class F sortase [Streptomyces mangrovisoli]|uniref:Class F sortase n=1 Tax=Streptomyces mangrovisoli TaxID=1428628 RepID=A0A1J4NYF5_9ACTN|nr:class F sortase [Streptomyces mangrovisoli]OIJ67090.1 class F sortase [Streptomyces mangrovisoli]